MVDDINPNETALLIPRTGVPSGPRDHRLPYQKRLAVYLILATTTLESIAFYSLTVNLFIILRNETSFNWDTTHTISLSFIFSGACYVFTLVFSVLSDGKFGRAKTIIIGFCLYLIGYTFIVLITHENRHNLICERVSPGKNNTFSEPNKNQCYHTILGTLLFTAIGIGSIQGNLAVFGAEQAQEPYEQSRYFDKFVLVTNLASFIAIGLISYLEHPGNAFINDENRYFYAYLFAILSLFTAFVIFLAGKRYFIYVKPDETIVTKIFPVLINAIKTWWKYRHHKTVVVKMKKQKSSMNILVETSDEYDDNSVTVRGRRISSILDYARRSNKGKYLDRTVNDIKALRRIVLVFILIIPFGLTNYQTDTSFILQSQYMDKWNTSNGTIEGRPFIWMNLFDPAGTIISLLFLRIFIGRYLEKRNKSISIEFKFISGMIIASGAMITAGIVEVFRQKSCRDDIKPISILSQLPQYFVMGIAELFFGLGSLEFAYLAAPNSASSLVMSLRYCSLGLSSFLGFGYVQIYEKQEKGFEFSCDKDKQINDDRLYTYFFVLAVIPLITALLVGLCNRKFQIFRLHPYKTDQRPFF